MTETLSMQLYSGRNFSPLADQLRILSEAGYSDVETFRGLYDDLAGLKSALDAANLSTTSGHYSFDLLENEYDRSLEIAGTLGHRILVLPYLMPDERPSDVGGWAGIGARVHKIAEKLKAQGLRCAWHNHDFEMRPLADGTTPLEHILGDDPAVEWEADLAWVVRGDEDPVKWVQRYRGRIAALHVKDIAPAGQNTDEDGWADVGEGTLGWDRLWQAGREAGAKLMIAEHDNPSDFRRFATTSLAAMRAFAERT